MRIPCLAGLALRASVAVLVPAASLRAGMPTFARTGGEPNAATHEGRSWKLAAAAHALAPAPNAR